MCSPHFTPDADGFVPLRAVSIALDGGQVQYISYYLEGIGGRPNLSEGLRFKGGADGNYHAIVIHQDDVEELARRIRAARN